LKPRIGPFRLPVRPTQPNLSTSAHSAGTRGVSYEAGLHCQELRSRDLHSKFDMIVRLAVGMLRGEYCGTVAGEKFGSNDSPGAAGTPCANRRRAIAVAAKPIFGCAATPA